MPHTLDHTVPCSLWNGWSANLVIVFLQTQLLLEVTYKHQHPLNYINSKSLRAVWNEIHFTIALALIAYNGIPEHRPSAQFHVMLTYITETITSHILKDKYTK